MASAGIEMRGPAQQNLMECGRGIGGQLRGFFSAIGGVAKSIWRPQRFGGRAVHGGLTDCLAGNGCGAPRLLEITSSCDGAMPRVAERSRDLPDKRRSAEDEANAWKLKWEGYCACCKRPLTIQPLDEPPRPSKRGRRPEEERCAYVVALWGTNPEIALGAMVLGWSLKRTGTRHDLVAMHTWDVPAAAVELLRQSGWQPRKVDYIHASPNLFADSSEESRFARVFTKLRVLELTEYAKVLMLDADLLVRQNIDDLFDLEAPAALSRGPWSGYKHGDRIMGKYFFWGHLAQSTYAYSWGQSGGINAGVMLLKPDADTFHLCLQEVSDDNHPSHIKGNGPEQDYLSRFYADTWSHLDVAYNFQLHQMYFVLAPRALQGGDRLAFLHDPNRIKVVHYSGDPKPWMRHLNAEYNAMAWEDWFQLILRNFSGYCAWVLREEWAIRKEGSRECIAVGPDGQLHKTCWPPPANPEGEDPEEAAKWWTEDGWPIEREVFEVPQEAIRAAENIVRMAVNSWDVALEELKQDLGKEDLVGELVEAMTWGSEKDNNWYAKDNGQSWRTSWSTTWSANGWSEKNGSEPRNETWNGEWSAKAWDEKKEPGEPQSTSWNETYAEDPGEASSSRAWVTPSAVEHKQEQCIAHTDEVPAINGILPHAARASVASSGPTWGRSVCAPWPDSRRPPGRWTHSNGWWAPRHPGATALATATTVPHVQAVLAAHGQTFLSSFRDGVHVAALLSGQGSEGHQACPAPCSFSLIGAEAVLAAMSWAQEVPPRAIVLVAVVDQFGIGCCETMGALAKGGLACPAEALPAGCRVAATAGHKGDMEWYTHASSEAVLAEVPVFPN